jgi:hypothetical protein
LKAFDMIRSHKHLNVLILTLLTASLGMAAAQSEIHARDVFRSARDRFYKTNPQVSKPEPAKPTEQATDRKPAPAPRPKPPKPTEPKPTFTDDDQPALRPVVNAPLGLRYSLMRQTSEYAAEEVDVDTVFHSGDKIKIKLESTDMAYLYILAKGSSGRWRVLFPSADIAGGAHRVRPDEDLSVPPRGWFAFDEQAGEEKVFVMLSRRKVDDLDQAIERLRKGSSQPVQAPSAPADDVPVMLAMHVAGARDLVFEKVSHTDAKPGTKQATAENAAYVVTKSAGPDSQVVAELTLKHR